VEQRANAGTGKEKWEFDGDKSTPMIKFSELTPEELALLADSPFAGFRAHQVPSNWRDILAVHPSVRRSDCEPAVPTGKRVERHQNNFS
jgi:hypothetical protein